MEWYLWAFVVIIILLLVWHYQIETFAPCSDCDQKPVPPNGMVVLNPYQWPYSAYGDPDDIYKSVANGGAEQALAPIIYGAPPMSYVPTNRQIAPLTAASVPDHVLLTN